MAEEFEESFSSFNLWSSLRCSDVFSCSSAANAGDGEETFGCFPATNNIFELSKVNAFDNLTQPPNLDLLSSSFEWPQSFLESSATNFQVALLENRATTGQCKIHMDYAETAQDSLMDVTDHGFFRSDETISESAMDKIQIFPTVDSSLFSRSTASDHGRLSTSVNTDPTAKINTTASRDLILPLAKKIRIETPSPLPTFKVRKEKLGDRITALQQLVSPFGKTDTASVLHEAIQHIKFLHDQLNILERQTKNGDWAKKDLRSIGLCLVPISTTFAVASNELPQIDFWSQLWNIENS